MIVAIIMADTHELSSRQQEFWGGLTTEGERQALLLKERLQEKGYSLIAGESIPLGVVSEVLKSLGFKGEFERGMIAASLLNFASGGLYVEFDAKNDAYVYRISEK